MRTAVYSSVLLFACSLFPSLIFRVNENNFLRSVRLGICPRFADNGNLLRVRLTQLVVRVETAAKQCQENAASGLCPFTAHIARRAWRSLAVGVLARRTRRFSGFWMTAVFVILVAFPATFRVID